MARTFNVQSIMTAPELYAHNDPSSVQRVDVKKEIVNKDTMLFQEAEQDFIRLKK